jgi:hypothetical protein
MIPDAREIELLLKCDEGVAFAVNDVIKYLNTMNGEWIDEDSIYPEALFIVSIVLKAVGYGKAAL